MTPKFNVVPKDIEGVLQYLDGIFEKVNNLEQSHKELGDAINALERKFFKLLLVFGIAVAAKYGIDLSGVQL
jgi:hypothetical protein